MRKRFVLIASILLLITASFPSQAKKLDFEYDYPVVASRWNVDLGGFLVDLDTTASFGVGGVVGTIINLENVLDLSSDQQVVRVQFTYRIKKRHALDFGYLAINRSATVVLAQDIEFDGRLYSANAAVDSKFNMAQFKTIYKFSFINNGRVNAGISTGLSWFNLDASIAGTATALDDNGQPIGSATFDDAGTKLLAPIPSIGMFVEYAAAKWFVVRLQGQFFDLEVGDLDFRFSDTSLLMDFYFTKQVGIGIGLNTVSMEYTDSGDDPVNIEYRFGGVLFYLGLSF